MTRSMAYHDTSRCGGIGSCTVCLDRIWQGKEPVITPAADRLFNVFGVVVIVLSGLYLVGHVVWAVSR